MLRVRVRVRVRVGVRVGVRAMETPTLYSLQHLLYYTDYAYHTSKPAIPPPS